MAILIVNKNLKVFIFLFVALFLLAVLFPLLNDETPKNQRVMRLIQKAADAYGVSENYNFPKSYRDLYPFFPGGDCKVGGKPGILPPNPLVMNSNSTDYLLDLPSNVVLDLINGRTSSLKQLKKLGYIGYGVTTDHKRFAVVTLDKQPVVIVFTDHESYLIIRGNRVSRPGVPDQFINQE